MLDSDGDGVHDDIDECPDTPPNTKVVDARGCAQTPPPIESSRRQWVLEGVRFELRGDEYFGENLIDLARKGEGPFFMLLNTYRYFGHHVGDINRDYYRSKEEEADWKANRDPITNFGRWLTERKIVSEQELADIKNEVVAEAEAAVDYALNAAYPPASEVDQHVFAP